MKSILDNRPALAYAVNQAAEVAGYLWQKGWAERNGGNITLNITEFVDDEIKALPAISEVKQIGTTLPHLKGCYFYCKAPTNACATSPAGRWSTVPLSVSWMTALHTSSLPTNRSIPPPNCLHTSACTIASLRKVLPIKLPCTPILSN